MHTIQLRKGKEQFLVENRHPWIFSGAIEKMPSQLVSGDLARVYSHSGQFLAIAYFHRENSLSGRVLSFVNQPMEEVLRKKLVCALAWRKNILPSHTNAFRLVNAEADGLPGLIVDVYDDVLVCQIHTCGMEKLRDLLWKLLQELLSPRGIYEKSTSSARLQEGLALREGWVYGQRVEEIAIEEYGIRFVVNPEEGQKTGFFLDQREMRKKVGELSKGKRVLNCFAYTGGFSLYALQGGAEAVCSVDICPKACHRAFLHTELNGFLQTKHSIIEEDVFAFLSKEDLSEYDVIIVDPPAFAKKRQDIESASKGYRKLAEMVFQKCKVGTVVLLSSCSYFIGKELFQQLAFQAASASHREVVVLSHHIQAGDHPVSLYHPEGEYLKSLLLGVQ